MNNFEVTVSYKDGSEITRSSEVYPFKRVHLRMWVNKYIIISKLIAIK